MSVTIRFASVDDIPVIQRFICQLADYEKLAHEVKATQAQLTETLFGEKAYAEVLIAEHQNAPAGFALFFHNYSTFLAKPGIYLEDLFVLKEKRGLGIGKLLLKKLAQIAEQRDCARLEWWVLDWNEPAIEFYHSLGAVPMDEWTVFRLTESDIKRLADGPLE